MTTFLLTLLVLGFIVAAMAIGVIMGRKPISGSCGGLAALGLKESCDICGGNDDKCREENERAAREATTDLAYDATRVGDPTRKAPPGQ
jgi:hypothetical protein